MSPRAKARRPADASRVAPRTPELVAVVVERAELREVVVRLLEVVSEDLLVLRLAVAVAVDRFGPVGEPLVQRRARPLEERRVGGVPDQ